MKRISIVFLFLLLFTSCDIKEEPVEERPVTTFDDVDCHNNQQLFGRCIDKTKPELIGVTDIQVEYMSDFDPLFDVTAFDDIDGNITASIQVSGHVNTSEIGEYFLVYTVSDSLGNTDTKMRYVTVVSTGGNQSNLVLNGHFTNNSLGWGSYISGDTSAIIQVENGELKVEVLLVSDVVWSPRLDYQGMYIESGKEYQLQFYAYALQDRTIQVQVGELILMSPYFDAFTNARTFELTTTKTLYQFTFTMNDSTNTNGAILFELGFFDNQQNLLTTVFFDDVRLEQIE